MSLLVWLPLTNNYKNQGLSDLVFTPDGTNTTVASDGKIHANCFSNNSYTGGGFISDKKLDFGKNLSICCWVKFNGLMDASALGGSMGGQHRYPTNTGMGLTFKYITGTTGYLSCNTGDGSDRTYNTYCGNTLLSAGSWYHVCMTYDGSHIRFYVNGQFDGSHAYSAQKNVADYVHVFTWSSNDNAGGRTIHPNYKLNGCMNDFRMYNHTLNEQEIKEIAKGLRIHYQLNAARFENLLGRNEMHVYNNYSGSGTTGSLVDTGEKFMGETVYRLTMTPNSSSLNSFKTEMGSHGIHTPSRTYAANTAYHYSVFYRPVSHTDVIVGGVASNINGWTEIAPKYWGDGWHQVGQYRYQGSSAQTDGIYTSFRCPSAASGVPIVIDFCCQSLIAGVTDIVQELNVNEYYNLIEPDVSGYGSHGFLSARVSNDPGAPKYQGGYWFSNQYLRLPTASYSAMKDSYTFSWWSSNSNMDGKMAWGFEDGNRLNLYPSSWFNWNTGDSADNPFRDSNGSNVGFTPYNGGWHHYAITGNGSKTTLYIDGVARATAKNYVGITGTKLLLSGWDTSGSYKWHGGLCDFRLYATCLSAEDVRDLCKTGAIITSDGTLMATEFSEFEPDVSEANFNTSGTVRALNFTGNNAQVSDMKMKALPDGSVWARIYKHDVRRTANWFNASQTQKISTSNRYSQMNLVDTFKASDGTYEFMWTQPEEEVYCPSGYTLLDCVESTGNQYIRTGVYPYQDGNYVRGHRWEFDMSFKADGVRQLMGYGPNGGEYWGMAASNVYEKTSVPVGGRDAIVHDYSGGTAGGNSLWVKYGSCAQGNNLTTSQEYTLFALNWSGGPGYYSKNKLYGCKCWKGKEKIRDFIPVRRHSDSCVGLYDLVTRKFYAPSGGPLLGHEIDKYIPIEYIESNGNQYIDTGIAWNKANSYKMTTKVVYTTTSPANQIMGFTGNRGCGIGSEYATWWECSSHPFAANTTYNLEWGLNGTTGENYRTINGTTFSLTGGGAGDWVGNMHLFAAHLTSSQAGFQPSYHCYCKMYEAKIYVNNQLVRDFIPVYSTLNQRNGLYDKLNHKFYGSVTRDNFYAGPTTCEDPSSLYEFYEYLASVQGNGQYINTGYNPTNNTSIYIKATPVNGTSIFGCAQGEHYFNLTTSGDLTRTYFYWGNQSHRDAFINSIGNQTHYFTLDNARSTFNGNTLGTYSNYSFNIGYPIALFARNVNGSIGDIGACRIYECDIYESGVLQRSFHPAKRKSDGAVGMYDCITGGFYTNSGSGSWLTGPRIYKEPIPQYNRWRQTNSPNTSAAATGVGFISSSWLNQFNGLVKFHNSGTCDYCCDTHNGTWYAPLGQRSVWEGGIPGAHGGMIKSTELWVRVDRLEAANNLIIVKPNTIACKNYMEI